MKKYQVGGVLLFVIAFVFAVALYHIMLGTLIIGLIFSAIGITCLILFQKKG